MRKTVALPVATHRDLVAISEEDFRSTAGEIQFLVKQQKKINDGKLIVLSIDDFNDFVFGDEGGKLKEIKKEVL